MPPIAAEFGLKVTVGAWIDKDADRNEREIESAINLARHNSNVIGVVVGNETIYRGEQKVEDLIKLIKRVKKSVNVPVTTGEIWNIWRDNPRARLLRRLHRRARAALLGKLLRQAGGRSGGLIIYQMLRDQFPGKRIMIAEFGWPSAGYNLRNADPGPFEQAVVLRNFVTRAEAIGMEYNIVEAIDQPWKFFEGGVGPYWGILNAAREPKFAWTGPIVEPGLLEARHHRAAGRHPDVAADPAARAADRAAGADAVGRGQRRRRLGRDRVRLLDRALFRVRLGLCADARLDPAGAAGADRDGADRGNRRHRLWPQAAPADRQGRSRWRRRPSARASAFPKVSIHVPAYFEPPEMLKQTLDAVSRLDYPNFECVVIINNTPDPEFWQPIQDHCRALGERFKFINAEKVKGFKAGALRIAMERTAADAEIIGIIDADYVVRAGLAEGSGAGVRRSARRPGAGAAGPSRRRPFADALHHERRICRVLRYRHGPAQRGQRHHRARHHVPDPPRGDGHGRRLGRRHHLRGHRSRPCHHRARLADALHQPPLRPRPAAGHL